MSKLGPILPWALYLLGCRWVAPQVLPFLIWAAVVCALLLCVYGVLTENVGPAHHDVLYNKTCRGIQVETSRRLLDNGKVEVSRMCERCKTVFFETEQGEL